MMRPPPFYRRQQGVSLLAFLFLVIVLYFTMGAVVTGSRNATPQAETHTYKLQAAAIIDQGATYAQAFAYLVNSGRYVPGISYDMQNEVGLLAPNGGGVPLQEPPRGAFSNMTSPNGFWVYKYNNVYLPEVGDSGMGDYTMIVSGLSLPVCQEINRSLHGSATTYASGVPAADWRAPGTSIVSAFDMTMIDLTAVVALERKYAACVSTTDSVYVYYHTLHAR